MFAKHTMFMLVPRMALLEVLAARKVRTPIYWGLTPFRQRREFEADHMAVMMLAHAGLEPWLQIDFMKRINGLQLHQLRFGRYQIDRNNSDSHPSMVRRIKAMEAIMPQALEIYERRHRDVERETLTSIVAAPT